MNQLTVTFSVEQVGDEFVHLAKSDASNGNLIGEGRDQMEALSWLVRLLTARERQLAQGKKT